MDMYNVPTLRTRHILSCRPPDDRTQQLVVAIDPGPGFGVATYPPNPAVQRMNFESFTYQLGTDGHGLAGQIVADACGSVSQNYDGKALVCEKFEYRKDDAEFRERIDFTAAE